MSAGISGHKAAIEASYKDGEESKQEILTKIQFWESKTGKNVYKLGRKQIQDHCQSVLAFLSPPLLSRGVVTLTSGA